MDGGVHYQGRSYGGFGMGSIGLVWVSVVLRVRADRFLGIWKWERKRERDEGVYAYPYDDSDLGVGRLDDLS